MNNLPANTDHLKQYNQRMIRTHWDEAEEKWYFSIVDVVAVLTESVDPQNYWRVLKMLLSNRTRAAIPRSTIRRIPLSDKRQGPPELCGGGHENGRAIPKG